MPQILLRSFVNKLAIFQASSPAAIAPTRPRISWSLSSAMSRFEKSGAISVDAAPPAPPPAAEAELSVSWLISSKLAMLLLASSAAEPTPSNAFCSAFNPCAADFCEDQLLPDSMPKNFAIAVTTCVRMSTSFTKTGITT